MSTSDSRKKSDIGRDRTRVAVLGALSVEPMTGAEMRTAMKETIGHFWQESYGQIYPTLSKLEGDGLVTGEPVDVGRGRRYHITPEGSQVFKELIDGIGPPPPPRNTLLLQVFFGRQMGPSWTREQVQADRDFAAQQLEVFDAVDAEIASDSDHPEDRVYWQSTVDFGRHMAEARLEWADDTID